MTGPRLLALVLGILAVAPLEAQRAAWGSARAGSPATTARSAPALPHARQDAAPIVPYGVGERMDYEVKFGAIRVGSGLMEVQALDTVRGRPTYRTEYRIKGGAMFYKVDDTFRSWIDTVSGASLRAVQNTNEGRYHRNRTLEFFPERATSSENGRPEEPSVPLPLDEGAFLYFIRTVPLEVGQTYTYHRYWKPDRNPVRIRVLRRERVTVPAGTFDAIVVQPIIKAKGIFSEGGNAQVWLSDDANRMMLQMKSNLSFGSINLFLRSFRLGRPPAAPARRP